MAAPLHPDPSESSNTKSATAKSATAKSTRAYIQILAEHTAEQVAEFVDAHLGERERQWMLEMDPAALPVDPRAFLPDSRGRVSLHKEQRTKEHVRHAADLFASDRAAFAERYRALRVEKDPEVAEVKSVTFRSKQWLQWARHQVHTLESLGARSGVDHDTAERAREWLQLPIRALWERQFTEDDVEEMDGRFARLVDLILATEAFGAVEAHGRGTLKTRRAKLKKVARDDLKQKQNNKRAKNQDELYHHALAAVASNLSAMKAVDSQNQLRKMLHKRFGPKGKGWPSFGSTTIYKIMFEEGFIYDHCGVDRQDTHRLGLALHEWFCTELGGVVPPEPTVEY